MNNAEKPAGSRGAAYIRVSHGDKQDPERQREAIRAWAKNRNLTVPRWYEDTEGRNPRDRAEDRPQFQQLIRDIKAGDLDWVVVDSQDRFGVKDQFEFGYYAHTLRQHDCELWSVGQGLLTSTDDATVFTTTVGNVTSTREQREKGQRSIGAKRRLSALGEWQGGYVAFGYDVACVDRETGQERWRVVVKRMIPTQGIWERVVIHPDGQQERCDGKDRFPRKQTWERLVLAPSVVAERVKAVREIFKLFASGSWSVRGLCQRLNEHKVDPVVGLGWYHTRLKPLLRNPVYHVGATVYGKNSHGRHAWFVGGEYLVPPRVAGRPKAGRRNTPQDWVFPPPGQAVIDKALWDEVQARLDSPRPAIRRGLRDERLWLAGLLICARCGSRMTGWSQGGPFYACTSYRKFGVNNPSGCRLYRVPHDRIERLLGRYLAEVAPDVRELMSSLDGSSRLDRMYARPDVSDDPLAPLDDLYGRRADSQFDLEDVLEEMRAFAASKGASRVPESPQLVLNLYRRLFDHDRDELNAHLAKKEAELRRLLATLNGLPEGAAEARREQTKLVAGADAAITRLRAEATPLTERLDRALADLASLDRAIGEARAALPGEDARRKALAVRRVVERVELHFDHLDRPTTDRRSKAKSVRRSPLTRAVFVPVTGSELVFTTDTAPGRG